MGCVTGSRQGKLGTIVCTQQDKWAFWLLKKLNFTKKIPNAAD